MLLMVPITKKHQQAEGQREANGLKVELATRFHPKQQFKETTEEIFKKNYSKSLTLEFLLVLMQCFALRVEPQQAKELLK